MRCAGWRSSRSVRLMVWLLYEIGHEDLFADLLLFPLWPLVEYTREWPRVEGPKRRRLPLKRRFLGQFHVWPVAS